MSLNLFRKKSIAEISALLNVHPFDVARYFGQKEGGLPSELQFASEEVKDISKGMRIEFWWKGAPELPEGNRAQRLIQALAQKLLDFDWGKPTRRDNLPRGLDGEDYRLIMKVVNTLIMMEILQSVATSDGVDVELMDGVTDVLEGIADGSRIPTELDALI